MLPTPKIVPVFFPNDSLASQLTDFASNLGGTSWWAAATSEYGVGAATAIAPIYLTESAPTTIDDSDIQTWLTGKLNSDDPAWPANDGNTIYVVHYPESTTITLQGTTSCQDFGGYHSDTSLDANHGSAEIAYVVVPRCSSLDSLTGIDAVTGAESHELIEASTDPFPMTNPAWALMDDAHIYWLPILGGGEVADMCAQFENVFTKFAGFNYTVQRSWSNAAALAGHDPCVPVLPGEVYFNTAPELPDTIPFSIAGQTVNVPGVSIPVGQSKTIELDLFSDAATTGPWTVAARDTATLFGAPANLSFSLNNTTGINGDKLQLTITVNSAGRHNNETFLLSSTLNGQTNLWFGAVGN